MGLLYDFAKKIWGGAQNGESQMQKPITENKQGNSEGWGEGEGEGHDVYDVSKL
ncbi:hypothetical protein LSG31_12915 [Fodinisporobacter ferrooxydans]|uniref:Uncharacterized protein n=1 Tax=Fodinisporobacter ferrooxydans TaxID=2901836 RepID=A0ABY4CEA0_9BACL|nr:hypothetical protein LSG31_12915 [Alicyclobacillaceae bacterium MYW30-H2]